MTASRITEAARQSRGGRSIDEFEILAKLGQGASGVAYKVRDKRSGEVLAMKQVKIVDSDPGDLANKINEIAVVKSFRHPYISKQKDYFYDARRRGGPAVTESTAGTPGETHSTACLPSCHEAE